VAGDLNHLRTGGVPPAPMETYLRDVEGRIPRWRRARRAVLAELADGLCDAAEHYVARGVSPDQAAARAVRDSGPAPVVAQAISEVLSAAQARTTAAALVLTGPVVGMLWLSALVPGRPPSALLVQRPGIGLSVAAAALFAGLTVLATRFAHLPNPHLTPARTAAIACAAAALCDVSLIAVAVSALTSHSSQLMSPLTVAGAASMVRLALTQRVARRDLVFTGS
jgi:hypothetical protein